MDFNNIDFEDVSFDETDKNEAIYLKKSRAKISFSEIGDEPRWSSENSSLAKQIDERLLENSEADYRKIAKEIVSTSTAQLRRQNRSKNRLKLTFTLFFIIFISVQYLALIAILALQILSVGIPIGNEVIIVYITSVFVETLSAIFLMVKYSFDSQQETNVLSILNDVISNYQKFNTKTYSARRNTNKKEK